MLYNTFLTLVSLYSKANKGDVILISNVNEIPKPKIITLLRYYDFSERLTLRSLIYYYLF
jgi:beta-1,4-mannosyl-glycoprotein beta-1,4-N-acetylglucosaminyltransferase